MSYACKTLINTNNRLASREKRISICLGANGFSFAEVATGGQLLTFGEAVGTHSLTMTGVMADVKAFFASVGIRPLGYASMELVVLSNESTWVPDELYSSLSNRKYLQLVGSNPEGIMTCHSRALASTAVFATDEQLVTAFKVAMPGIAVMHQHAKMAALAPAFASRPTLMVHWRQGRVDVAAFRGGRYVYGNTLSFNYDSEAIYHIVEVMKSYELEGQDTELLVCGDVDRKRYALLRPYFPKTALYNGTCRIEAPELSSLHTYRHALILS